MSKKHKYRAFLSYSHSDLKWADWLHRELERYRVPPRLRQSAGGDHPMPRNLRPVFRDRDDLPSGSSLPQVIRDALVDSESLIVICSPSAVTSEWVDDEIRTFQQLGRQDRIFCLIVDGEPLSGGLQECFPKALRQPVNANGQPLASPEEPIAADLRGGRHQRRHAKLMIIAGLLGIGLDELLQRDHHRRSRKLFAITTTTTLLALIMAGLMVFAFLSQAEAERRRADAENLIGFMLGDLREDLHAIQRLDLYSSVSEKAMDYFRSLGEEDARDEVLAQRAEALRQIGSSRLDKADIQGALDAFDEALEISTRLVLHNPSRVDWNLALAESHFYIGHAYWQRSDFAAAGAKFHEQLSIVDALAAAEPENTERLAHSGYAWTNYGRVLELNNQYAEALQAYEIVMDVFQRLVVLQPDDVDSWLEVGFAHNNLGKLKASVGLLEEAGQHFHSDLEIKQQVVRENPNHNLWRGYLAGSYVWLGKLLSTRGELLNSQNQGEAAVEILDVLMETDPTMTPWRQRRAVAHNLLAANCRMTGDLECAATYAAAALADFDKLTTANPENAQWLYEQNFSKLEAAWQAAFWRDLDRATNITESIVKAIESSLQQTSSNRETYKLMVTALLTLGDISHQASRPEAAAASWQTALGMLEAQLDNSQDPEVIDLRAKLLFRHGNVTEALRAEEKLEQMGYYSPYPRLLKDLHIPPIPPPVS